MAWTEPGSTNGWLALDLNGNGKIDSAFELFGNLSAQPKSSNPNGFLALAQYDTNHDGLIDARDPIWSKLLVWIDVNHDGISQPEELHSLDEFGIRAISLSYHLSPLTDDHGNQFRYKGHLINGPDTSADRIIYDVFLAAEP